MTIPSFLATLSPCPAICSNCIRLQVFLNRQQPESTSTIVSTVPLKIAPPFYILSRYPAHLFALYRLHIQGRHTPSPKVIAPQITRLVHTCSHFQKDQTTVLPSSQDASKSPTSEGQVGALRVRTKQSIGAWGFLTSNSDTIILSSLANPKNERTLSLAFVSAPRLRREGDEVSTQSTHPSRPWRASSADPED